MDSDYEYEYDSNSDFTPTNLLCEFLTNPLAIDNLNPRLAWRLEIRNLKRSNLRQYAYQIIVATALDKLTEKEADLWNTGKVISNENINIIYKGKNLKSRQKIFWKVKIWNEKDQPSRWSKPAFWTMGILNKKEWNAKWIGLFDEIPLRKRFSWSERVLNKKKRFRADQTINIKDFPGMKSGVNAALYLYKDIMIEELPSEFIIRYVGLGYSELFINGKKILENKLDPAFSNYNKTIYYNSLEAKNALKVGKNRIGLILGGGWYFAGTRDLFSFEIAPWTAPPKALVEIEIKNSKKQGSTFIGSDETWKITNQGPIRFNSIRSGEIYDSRLSFNNWNIINNSQQENNTNNIWKSARVVPEPKGKLRPQLIPPIKKIKEIKPKKIVKINDATCVAHFPENTAGWTKIRLKTKGMEGKRIIIKHSERLSEQGILDFKTTWGHTYGPFQTSIYICSGKEIEEWEPRFTYHGFQYVQIEGINLEKIESIIAIKVSSAFKKAGEFSCSDPLINAIQEMALRTFTNNFHSIPEDCPHREKMGWMEDGLISAHMSIFNYNMHHAYIKWIRDMQDIIDKNGNISSIVPTAEWGRIKYQRNKKNKKKNIRKKKQTSNNMNDKTNQQKNKIDLDKIRGQMSDPWWGGAIILLPLKIFEHYADFEILKETYPAMKNYIEFLINNSEDYIIKWELGDWLEIGAKGISRRTPVEIISTLGFYYWSKLMQKIATILRKKEDSQYYKTLSEKIKESFIKKYLEEDKKINIHESIQELNEKIDSQSMPSIALFTELISKEMKNEFNILKEYLIFNIKKKHNNHLTTGIVGTFFLFFALSYIENDDLIMDLLLSKEFPSWGYMIKKGATTIWEDWEGKNSLDHPVQGAIGAWFYNRLAGIIPLINTQQSGFKRFIIRPFFSKKLTYAIAKLETYFGTIISKWTMKERTGKSEIIQLELQIPWNTEALLDFKIEQVKFIEKHGEIKKIMIDKKENNKKEYNKEEDDKEEFNKEEKVKRYQLKKEKDSIIDSSKEIIIAPLQHIKNKEFYLLQQGHYNIEIIRK